jgi:hypothetical protein
MAAGATIASANTAAATTSAYSAGVAAGSATTAAATSSAYQAGVATGSATTATAYNAGVAAGSAAGPAAYMMGGIYPTLPAGCITPKVQGNTYYLCGNTWFQPSYGANGVSYRVVPTP